MASKPRQVCLQTAGGVGLERKVRLQSPRPEVFVGEERVAAMPWSNAETQNDGAATQLGA